jgi:hypothetical protein
MNPAPLLRLLAGILEIEDIKQPLEELLKLLQRKGGTLAFKQLVATGALQVILSGRHFELQKIRSAVGLTSLKTTSTRLQAASRPVMPVGKLLASLFGPPSGLELPQKVLDEQLAPSASRDVCAYHDVHSSPLKATFVSLLTEDMARDGFGHCQLIDLVDIAQHQLPRTITHVVCLLPVLTELLPDRLTKRKRVYIVRKIQQRNRNLSSFHLMSLVDINRIDRKSVAYLGVETTMIDLRQKAAGRKRKKIKRNPVGKA